MYRKWEVQNTGPLHPNKALSNRIINRELMCQVCKKKPSNNKLNSYLLSGNIVWPAGFSEVKEHLLLPSSADTASLETLKIYNK